MRRTKGDPKAPVRSEGMNAAVASLRGACGRCRAAGPWTRKRTRAHSSLDAGKRTPAPTAPWKPANGRRFPTAPTGRSPSGDLYTPRMDHRTRLLERFTAMT